MIKGICSVIVMLLSVAVSAQQFSIRLNQQLTHNKRQNLILYDNKRNVVDTLAEFPSSFSLIDFHIKSRDSISVIVKSQSHYTYLQFVAVDSIGNWSTSSVGFWQEKPWSSKSSIDEVVTETFSLRDYYTVIKRSNGTETIVELTEQMNKKHK